MNAHLHLVPPDPTTARVPPHDLVAERAVLGAILIENAMLETARSTGLTAEGFYRDAHQRIFRTLEGLAARRSALDLVTLVDALGPELAEVGGPAYVASLLDGVPRSTNVEAYARIVYEKATLRGLIHAAHQTLADAYDADDPAASILDASVQRLLTLSGRADRGGLVEGPQLAAEAIAFLEELQQRRADRRTAGTPTGFVELDATLDGFQPGHLIVLAGRTSDGKSALALQCAIASESCAYFSCEMERGELAIRELAVLARVNGWAMRRGILSSGEQAAVGRSLDHLAESGVAIDDTPAISLAQIRARARQRQITRGLRLIVVDYLQLCAPDQRRKDQTREQDVAGIVRGLKALAMELKVPVLALSQFSRALEPGKEPTLSHLRESGEIEQAANVVLLIHRPDGQNVAKEGDAQIIIAKNRGGPKGTITLRWLPDQTRFADRPRPEPQQGAFA